MQGFIRVICLGWTFFAYVTLVARLARWAHRGELGWGDMTVALCCWRSAATAVPFQLPAVAEFHGTWRAATPEWVEGVSQGFLGGLRKGGHEALLRGVQRAMMLSNRESRVIAEAELVACLEGR